MAAVVRAIALLALSACVGDPGNGGNGNGSGSGSGSGGIDAAIDAPKFMWVDAANGMGSNVPCRNAATPPSDGHHFTGQHCMSCHNNTAPQFTLAGTLYTNSTGNSGFSGANITILDSNNQTINIVTSSNGNFYTTANIAFPVLVVASACPSAVKMNVAVAASGRSCNIGGCHPSGSTQIHLP